jgi:ABC-type nitrate/sulfonate/bicarbonate transport system substrate-binding protein
MKRLTFAAASLLYAAFGVVAPAAAESALIRINTFPTASYSPLFLGIANGVFEKRGIKVELRSQSGRAVL